MKQSDGRTAVEDRARWLTELAAAVADAQRLARTLSSARRGSAEIDDIHVCLEAVRIEVEQLRRGGWKARPTQIDPDWLSLFPGLRRSGS